MNASSGLVLQMLDKGKLIAYVSATVLLVADLQVSEVQSHRLNSCQFLLSLLVNKPQQRSKLASIWLQSEE